MEVRWSVPAQADFLSILDHIAADNPPAAARTGAAILARVRSLAEFPHRGRPGRAEDTRELTVPGSPYVVVYAVRRERIVILRVLHGRRRWPPE